MSYPIRGLVQCCCLFQLSRAITNSLAWLFCCLLDIKQKTEDRRQKTENRKQIENKQTSSMETRETLIEIPLEVIQVEISCKSCKKLVRQEDRSCRMERKQT